MNLIFLDTETTGNELGRDRLYQVCYKVGDGETKTEYFKPPVSMTVKSMSITHVTDKMLVDKPPFEGSQMQEDLAKLFIDGILVAHNAKFDIAMLEAEGLKVPKSICTLRVARFLDTNAVIPEYGLQFLRYYLGLEIEGNAHDAEGDVNVLYAVFNRLFAKIRETVESDEEAINKMIEISANPTLFTKFNFGKYKDRKLEEVLIIDRGYLEWLLRTKLQDNPDDEDWIYTLKFYLKV
ncbi:MAG: 3'-5' exonuclease [Parcubacteria group bacterium]|nr:3'-5' exonuclease [Parcubacteria group bacterium]